MVRSKCVINEVLLEQIYSQSWRKLYYICYNRLGDTEQSMDIVQNVFRSVWERRHELTIDDDFEKYLVKAVKLQLLNHFRNEATKEKNLAEFQHRQQTITDNVEAQFEYKVLCQKVKSLVDKLPERCQVVYKMSRERGMNNKEISHELLITEKTVENQLTKALSFLRFHLSEKKL